MLASSASSFGHATTGIQYEIFDIMLNTKFLFICLEQKIKEIY
jgi:hypothetical protein